MTGSATSGRAWYVIAVAVCAVLAAAVGVVLLRGDTEPEQSRFRAYSLVKSGGIAGVMHHVQVSGDGTVLYADDQPVAGRLPRRSIDRLSTLLSDPDLADEGGGRDSRCADAFRYTLTVGSTTVSRDDCGDGDTPLLDEIIGLTTKDALQPLPDDAPEFRGLAATYRQDSGRVKVRIAADGTTEVTMPEGQVRHDRVDTGTLDALRLLYAEPLVAPSGSGGGCAPVYEVTPEGASTLEVAGCGRMDDYRWVARLTIIRRLATT